MMYVLILSIMSTTTVVPGYYKTPDSCHKASLAVRVIEAAKENQSPLFRNMYNCVPVDVAGGR